MSSNNKALEDQLECPLCMEPLEVDDLNFYPCSCGYQVCRFCWHRIRTQENGLCPACRKSYPENPTNWRPLTLEEVQKTKHEKKKQEVAKKQKQTNNQKPLSHVRIVQKNLVFVIGLPPRLADPNVLKRQEYFGKFGKITKIVVNSPQTGGSQQLPSISAYVTYRKSEDALKAISKLNNISIEEGRTIKASLGATKYCSHFLKSQPCPKSECTYLHEMGESAASFTKEEMQQGKHQEYEKRLIEQLLNVKPTQVRAKKKKPAEKPNGTIKTSNHTFNDCDKVSKCPEISRQNNTSPSSLSTSSTSSTSPLLGVTNYMPVINGSTSHCNYPPDYPPGQVDEALPSDVNSSDGELMHHAREDELAFEDALSQVIDNDNRVSDTVYEPPPSQVPDHTQDDELGFDTFTEAVKALAEVMDAEKAQQREKQASRYVLPGTMHVLPNSWSAPPGFAPQNYINKLAPQHTSINNDWTDWGRTGLPMTLPNFHLSHHEQRTDWQSLDPAILASGGLSTSPTFRPDMGAHNEGASNPFSFFSSSPPINGPLPPPPGFHHIPNFPNRNEGL